LDAEKVREYSAADRAEWARLRTALWPDQTEADMAEWLSRDDAVTLVAMREDGTLCGFADVGERRWADGCDTRPIAYLEGWYVDPDVRRRGFGTAILLAADAWAVRHGYREIASDARLDNEISHLAHRRAGFDEIERVVLYAKRLDAS
jgi:aminoglycoside 6'-N-acetyltransferase I